ncbi:hypothetical protein JRO89_XS10G0188700 [Xanthoceras sorbifolium]|uniref:Uncharacterized protein n=1 Tax=Xanthoceras sorbifolium TaxID=99658 RepID=A0ABQ8HJJ9_9ROSI|nr:hypothetical protein JRO89_XS10G0188700 [Xanthoceras sorbifolium]
MSKGKTSHHVIEVVDKRDWIALVQQKMDTSPKMLSRSAGEESCCIFRVPQSLVEINEKAYQPHIVSMGPYHHGKQHLEMIQEHKWRYLGSLLARTRSHGVSFKDLFVAIEPLEKSIRECYSETITFDSRQLIEMMVLDGCFVIELFCMVGSLVPRDVDDPIFSMAWIFPFLTRDLLRLENQIPYFVLETLFELTILSSRRQTPTTLAKLALHFFNYMVQRDAKTLEQYYSLKGKHLLGLFRESFIPPSQETTRESSPLLQLIPSAKKLHLAGIEFKPRRTNSFLDIKFGNGVLEIPPLTIDDFTSSVFLNIVAFEQCYRHCTKHVTTYATLMGCLINTPGDAGFLSDHKIIENYFGTDEEVARFFNNVGKDVAFDIHRNYLSELFQNVNEHYRNNWHVRWASFKHTYFDTPWSFMSALAALILLLLTMIQSLFAVYAYVYPPKP